MARTEHLIADPKACHLAEPVVRDFVLRHAETVSLTMATWSEGWNAVHCGGFEDPDFRAVLNFLEPDISDTNTRDLVCAGTGHPEPAHALFTLKLSHRMRSLFGRQSLLWGHGDWGELYGLEDPTFYSSQTGFPARVCSVISHEPMIYLYLEDDELDGFQREAGIRWEY